MIGSVPRLLAEQIDRSTGRLVIILKKYYIMEAETYVARIIFFGGLKHQGRFQGKYVVIIFKKLGYFNQLKKASWLRYCLEDRYLTEQIGRSTGRLGTYYLKDILHFG